MNNIKKTNIIILKQSIVEKIDNNYMSYIYFNITIIQSQKKL